MKKETGVGGGGCSLVVKRSLEMPAFVLMLFTPRLLQKN